MYISLAIAAHNLHIWYIAKDMNIDLPDTGMTELADNHYGGGDQKKCCAWILLVGRGPNSYSFSWRLDHAQLGHHAHKED